MTRFRITLFAALLLLISCQKDPQPVNPSSGNDPVAPAIITPDIHDFMPSTLLNLFGEENIHQGNTPPDITGSWLADNLNFTEVYYADTSLAIHSVNSGNLAGATYFTFHDFDQSNLKTEFFLLSRITPSIYKIMYSDMDSTCFMLQNHSDLMINNPLLPSFFQTNNFDFSFLNKAYIIGTDDQFTIYFYDIALNQASENYPFSDNNFYPVTAKIISGKALRDQDGNITGIADFRTGEEVVGYVKDGNSLQMLIQNGALPTPGDAWIKTNQNIDLIYSEFSLE